MNRIIKSMGANGGTSVDELDESLWSAPARPEVIEAATLRQRVAELEALLEDREAKVESLQHDLKLAEAASHDASYQAGLDAADDKQRERLNLLEESLTGAGQGIHSKLEELERTAITLARECLEIMFEDAGELQDLVAKLVKNQLRQIDKSSLLHINVAKVDFPDDEAIESLALRTGLKGKSISAHDDLASGSCSMDLTLGQIEIGLRQQLTALTQKLDQMANTEIRQ